MTDRIVVVMTIDGTDKTLIYDTMEAFRSAILNSHEDPGRPRYPYIWYRESTYVKVKGKKPVDSKIKINDGRMKEAVKFDKIKVKIEKDKADKMAKIDKLKVDKADTS